MDEDVDALRQQLEDVRRAAREGQEAFLEGLAEGRMASSPLDSVDDSGHNIAKAWADGLAATVHASHD